jgi:heme exporter protein CcmD
VDFSARHIEFVFASYAITVVVILCLAVWIFVRARRLARRLEQLEAEGAARRRPAREKRSP